MKKDPLYIVFGAWDKPTKGLIGITQKDHKGKGILIGELKKDADFDFSKADKRMLDSIESVYAVLWFCKKESLDSAIHCLQSLRDTFDVEDEDGD